MNNNQEKQEKKSNNQPGAEEQFIEEGERKYAEEARGVASVNVKNASASGDGALERNGEAMNNNNNQNNAELG
ncbi:MAG TPA: hypothetical protein VM368_08360 [Flavisolibacter sp.]|nr:hypothetical protein [Flavisolibacter sp.]